MILQIELYLIIVEVEIILVIINLVRGGIMIAVFMLMELIVIIRQRDYCDDDVMIMNIMIMTGMENNNENYNVLDDNVK